MKIGILTFHRAKNYGAVLQCYALRTFLSLMGHDVEIIDYYPSYFKLQDKISFGSNFKGMNLKGKIYEVIMFFLCLKTKIKRKRNFNAFLNHLNLSEKKYDENTTEIEGYDLIIVGSDQVWNCNITQGKDNLFSGNFNKNHSKLAAYAASTMKKKGEYGDILYYKEIIKNFDNISVREESFNSYLNTLIPGCSICVADPVLLLEKHQWESMSIIPKEKDYLLIYTVPEDPRVRQLAEMIADAKKLTIVEIVSHVDLLRHKGCHQSLSPQQFVGYFSKAEFVVTTSFHGTAFSLKMEKQFCTLMLGTEVDSRAKNLLHSVNLDGRAVDANHLAIPSDEIDYHDVNNRMRSFVNDSISYLKEITE